MPDIELLIQYDEMWEHLEGLYSHTLINHLMDAIKDLMSCETHNNNDSTCDANRTAGHGPFTVNAMSAFISPVADKRRHKGWGRFNSPDNKKIGRFHRNGDTSRSCHGPMGKFS
jgi:hypothetical protein